MRSKTQKQAEVPSYTDYLADYYFHLQNMQRKGKAPMPKQLDRAIDRALRKRSPERERTFVRLILGA